MRANKTRKTITPFFVIFVLGYLTACSSLSSKVDYKDEGNRTKTNVGNGVIYYMPKKDIKLVVTVDASGIRKPSVESGDSMPDLSSRFVMDFSENWIGKNHLKIGINSKGLLTSTDSDVESGIDDILKNLAKAAGNLTAMGTMADSSKIASADCPSGQTVAHFVDPSKTLSSDSFCNFNILIERLGFSGNSNDSENFKQNKLFGSLGPDLGWSGLFYKQELPYRVTFTDKASDTKFQFIVFSPNESPVSFMPTSKTFFSDNLAKYTLTDGILTSAEQTTHGEIVALSALPADIISSYFQAIGTMFGQFNTNAANQKSTLENERALAVAEMKKQICLAAYAANNPTGKTGDELKAALDNVIKACQ